MDRCLLTFLISGVLLSVAADEPVLGASCIDNDCGGQPLLSSSAVQTQAKSEASNLKRVRDVLGKFNLDAKIAALVEEHSSVLGKASVDVTPGVKQTLKALIKMIEDSIFTRIKNHHNSTQQHVTTSVSTVVSRTKETKNAYEMATMFDTRYVEEIKDYEKCVATYKSCVEEFDTLRTDKQQTCKKGKQTTMCKQKNQQIKAKHNDCKNLENDCEADLDNAKIEEDSRDVYLCTFGDRLQEKCVAKKTLDDLMVDVEGSGSAFSDPDRRSEWESAGVIRCMLQKHADGAPFDATTMKTCRPLVDYSRDVGELDLQKELVQTWTSRENFNCVDNSFDLSGTEVVKTQGLKWQKHTLKSPQGVIANIRWGEAPFSVCAARADRKKCNDFQCGGGFKKKSDKTCALASGCIFLECCEQEFDDDDYNFDFFDYGV